MCNESTDFVRQCVNHWLAGNTKPFTVTQIVSELRYKHGSLAWIDVSKAVSNELQRLEKLGMLQSRKGIKGTDLHLVGRPPRVFSKVYCERSLEVLRRRMVVDTALT